MTRRGLAFAGLLLAAVATGTNARAEETAPIGFAGMHASFSSRDAYVGFVLPFPGERLGRGWFVRAVGSTLAYRYDTPLSGRTTRVHARAAGLQGGVGRAWSFDSASLELSSSLAARRTWLTPEDPRHAGQGVRWAGIPELAARCRVTPGLEGDLFANMALGWGDRYVRARLGARPANGWQAGLAVVSNQGRTYHERSIGAFASTSPMPGWWLEIDAGRAYTRDARTGAYWRMSTSWRH
jgi:hypothetical protein